MNKGRRNELAKLKRKKRLRHYVLDIKISDIPDKSMTILKSTGKPCSCPMCSPGKIEEKAKYLRDEMVQKQQIYELHKILTH